MIIFSGGIVGKKYYAYFLEDENIKGLVDNWDKCKSLVHGKKARYKSFPTENYHNPESVSVSSLFPASPSAHNMLSPVYRFPCVL